MDQKSHNNAKTGPI